MIKTIKSFENGCKCMIDPIDEDCWNIYVYLPEEERMRFTGNYELSTNILFIKRWPRHRHQILNAWGISSYVIDMLEPYGLKLIVLFLEGTSEVYQTTLENAKQVGVWKFWKELGFDRQLFIPLPCWERKH